MESYKSTLTVIQSVVLFPKFKESARKQFTLKVMKFAMEKIYSGSKWTQIQQVWTTFVLIQIIDNNLLIIYFYFITECLRQRYIFLNLSFFLTFLFLISLNSFFEPDLAQGSYSHLFFHPLLSLWLMNQLLFRYTFLYCFI